MQLNEIIKKGSFAYDGPINLDNVIAYAAPNYPEPPATVETKTSDLFAPPLMHLDDAGAGRFLKAQQLTPGIMGKPQMPTQYVQDITNAQQAINDPPSVDIQDMASSVFATSSGVGLQFKYAKDGLNVHASSQISIRDSGLSFFLTFDGIKPATFGIQLKGAAGVMLAMDASAAQEFKVNLHKTLFIPVDLSIPLGGPVPLSLNFSQSFTISTAFSAKTSVLNAKGDYGFSGGVIAGCWHGNCKAGAPSEVHANTDIGKSAEGISVGINSLVMGASIQALVGLGGFGFSTGVYGGLRFSGTVLRAPDIGFPCRQGTIETYIDAGLGYSLPQWLTTAVNFFLSPFTKKRSISGLPHQGTAGTVVQRQYSNTRWMRHAKKADRPLACCRRVPIDMNLGWGGRRPDDQSPLAGADSSSIISMMLDNTSPLTRRWQPSICLRSKSLLTVLPLATISMVDPSGTSPSGPVSTSVTNP